MRHTAAASDESDFHQPFQGVARRRQPMERTEPAQRSRCDRRLAAFAFQKQTKPPSTVVQNRSGLGK